MAAEGTNVCPLCFTPKNCDKARLQSKLDATNEQNQQLADNCMRHGSEIHQLEQRITELEGYIKSRVDMLCQEIQTRDNRIVELEKQLNLDSDEWVIVRWLGCDEYHAHSQEKDCFYYRVMREKDVEHKQAIISHHPTEDAAIFAKAFL